MLIIWVAIRGAAQSASHLNFSTEMANLARIKLNPPHISLFCGKKKPRGVPSVPLLGEHPFFCLFGGCSLGQASFGSGQVVLPALNQRMPEWFGLEGP